MIAAILDLDIGPSATVHTVDQVPGGLFDGHDVIHADLLGAAEQIDRLPGLGLHFLVIADHAGDFRHLGKHARINLRSATGDDDRRVRIVLGRAANGLARATNGLGGHRARIDDDCAIEAGRLSMSAHDFALIAVQSTAKRNDLRGPGGGFGLAHGAEPHIAPRRPKSKGGLTVCNCEHILTH